MSARTLRERFGVGLSGLGDALTWGEARELLIAAAGDTSTELGAELAGWAYAASTVDLLGVVASIGDERAAKRVMPWVMKRPGGGPSASVEELAEAEAEMEAGFVFA